MKSQIFYSDLRFKIEGAAKELLNSQEDFLSLTSIGSTRAVGDAIQNVLEANFQEILGEACAEYSASFARRAMADLAFSDSQALFRKVSIM